MLDTVTRLTVRRVHVIDLATRLRDSEAKCDNIEKVNRALTREIASLQTEYSDIQERARNSVPSTDLEIALGEIERLQVCVLSACCYSIQLTPQIIQGLRAVEMEKHVGESISLYSSGADSLQNSSMQLALTELSTMRGRTVEQEDSVGQLRSQISRLEVELQQTRIRFTESQSALNAAECEKARLLACLRTVDG